MKPCKSVIVACLLACLSVGGVAAKPLFLRSGGGNAGPPPVNPPPPPPDPGGGGGGLSQACDTADTSNVCALHKNGQTFITWPDMATGAAGNNYRYKVVRSTVPITADNYTTFSPFATEILNNSAQLFGGAITGSPALFTQANRQSSTFAMSRLTDLGAPLAYGTGLQVYTAQSNQVAYYAVIAVQCSVAGCPTGASGGSNTYIGSVGPMGETVATPKPVKQADSTRSSYGKIDIPVNNLPVVFFAHQSHPGGAGVGPGGFSNGDLWQWNLTPAEGWQDGRQTIVEVLLDKAQNYSQNLLGVWGSDGVWNPLGTGRIETHWYGMGMSPLSSVGPPNRKYSGTCKAVSRIMSFMPGQYNVDRNQFHWQGLSMGAWGGASCGMRSASLFSAVWMGNPIWRFDRLGTGGYWAGTPWPAGSPFIATLGPSGTPLGTVASSILTDTGAVWGGNGGVADIPNYVSQNPGNDIPVAVWIGQPRDGYETWSNNLEALNAFQSARRGHHFVWSIGTSQHDTGGGHGGLINCDNFGRDTTVCYSKSRYKLNAPYPAFSNSSIDDNPGTGVNGANGYPDGDFSGCINCGFSWTFAADSSGALNFTVDNNWMDRTPNPAAQTTISNDMPASGGGTVNVASAGVFEPLGEGNYFLINNSEIILVTAINSNQLTYTSRGVYGTGSTAHTSGQSIRQIFFKPTGPNAGAVSSMTVDITPRRMQGFRKATGATVTCAVTPDGDSTVTKTGTVIGTNGVFTITGVTINATGPTSISCS